MSKIKMYSLLKIKISQIIKANFNLVIEEESNFLVRLPNSPLFDQLKIVRSKDTDKISELIFVEAKRNKKQEQSLIKILNEGFTYNGVKFVRFGKSPSQGKDGITTFIKSSYFKEMTERSQLGLEINKCVISKYESYRSLIFSSCTLVENIVDKKNKLPYIVIVGEYEKTLLDQNVRYAEQKVVEYTDKTTGKKKISKNQKIIKNGTTDVSLSPFDGFGVHTPEMSTVLAKSISNSCKSVLFQIRLPFMKGITIEMDFKRYLKEVLKTHTITDVFGKKHNVDDIDCIWNTSMWKGYSYFKEAYGDNAWNTYLERLDKYNYKLGISKYSHHTDDLQLYSRMNFQYLQCLDLSNPKYIEKYKNNDFKYDIFDENNNGKIINLAKYTTDLIEKIVNGDKLYTLKFLGIHNTKDTNEIQSNYEKAILINDTMLEDISVKKMIKRRLEKSINMMKFGKIYVEGFYHTVVGDIIGYLEYCAGKDPIGCLEEGQFYAKTLPLGKVTSMRSPLVDSSEVNVVDLVNNDETNEWLSHFDNQDIVMINMYDLTMQQQGGMDMDGDSVLLTNNEIIISSRINLPIVVDMEDKKGAEPVEYNKKNITNYELNSRDSRIGEITNIATAILNQFTENEKWKKINEDNIALLRLYQGKEIDFLKTGFRWHITKNLRNYLKKMPHFLLYNYPSKLSVYNKLKKLNKELSQNDKVEYNAFNSPSPMNELSDYICQWERKKLKINNTVKNSSELLVDSSLVLDNKKLIREVASIYNKFTEELRDCVDDEDKVSTLYEKYKIIINELEIKYSDISHDELVNYCIKTAYRSMSIDKTLCWYLFGEEMIENLRSNSDESEECSIVECDSSDEYANEFLGKYYKLELVGDKSNA
ncbi:hypothetical protein [Lysinibacillus sp. NPDC086135]|uniref:hypothetical protein n=1 Tax=Lysinibacillus sp. NPDC086135 TaxID=3364130 RepID=UPI0037F9589E